MGPRYEAIEFLTQWIDWLALLIIPTAAALRIGYEAFQKTTACDEDEIAEHDKKIRRTIKGTVIAVTMGSTIVAFKSFYI